MKDCGTIIRKAEESDFTNLSVAIKEMQLDDTSMDYHQFIIAELNGEFAGFGRIKEYNDAKELCSLGVLPKYRGKGISRLLIKELKTKAVIKPLHVVTIIPALFKKFGFEEIIKYPTSLLPKINYCTNTLGGCDNGEQYVVMKRMKVSI
ncbi:MAG: GNAT family N-acetyltransferase [Bacteroidetes bacterium]|nr:GNAT family N-acetyltransferase [Bacteroidota bacterium]